MIQDTPKLRPTFNFNRFAPIPDTHQYTLRLADPQSTVIRMGRLGSHSPLGERILQLMGSLLFLSSSLSFSFSFSFSCTISKGFNLFGVLFYLSEVRRMRPLFI